MVQELCKVITTEPALPRRSSFESSLKIEIARYDNSRVGLYILFASNKQLGVNSILCQQSVCS